MKSSRSITAPRLDPKSSMHTMLLWLASILFGLRVIGQALQTYAPQPWLPPAENFQGSGLPYGLLLASQLLILWLMLRGVWKIQANTFVAQPAVRRALGWMGGLYMTAAMARLVIGLTVVDAPAWFRAWIPAAFHLVLAAYVLTLFDVHRRRLLASSKVLA